MKRLGIDIGSTTVKVAVIDENHRLLFSEYQRHFARIKETLRELLTHAREQLGDQNLWEKIYELNKDQISDRI